MFEGSSTPYRAADGSCHYFRVAAIDAELKRLQALGVVFEGVPHLIAKMPDHELRMAFFRDPDVHLLGLMEERR
jgi:methylmalonyl-CoA/ethylmalonyl-CoA epimerase